MPRKTELNSCWYTVVLLYPDYMGSDNPRGFETYVGQARTDTVVEAVAKVRQQAVTANDRLADPDDFAVLAVFAGQLEDLNPECP